jgi:hypothetical protein
MVAHHPADTWTRVPWRPCRDGVDDVPGVPADAVDHGRGGRVQEVQADEVQAGLVADDPAPLERFAPLSQHRQVDPGEAVVEPAAPDDVGHLQDPAVLEQRHPVAGPDDLGGPLDAGGGEVAGPDPDQRHASAGELGPQLAAQRRAGGQHPVEHHPEHQADEEEPGRGAVDAEGDLADVPSRQPGPVPGGELEGDLRPRVARADHQDGAVLELGGVAVVGRVQLDDAGVELAGEVGHPGPLVVGHRHHHVVGFPPPLARRHHQPAVLPRQPVHPDAGPDRELEPGRVGLQVVGHLVLGGEGPGRGREGHPHQPAVAGRGEQPQ